MDIDEMGERVFAAERILKKRIRKVRQNSLFPLCIAAIRPQV